MPPLVELAKQLEGTVEAYIGVRSEPILVDRLQELGAIVHVATDDGSRGFHGNVVQMMEATGAKGDALYACGPKVPEAVVTGFFQTTPATFTDVSIIPRPPHLHKTPVHPCRPFGTANLSPLVF